MAAKAVQPSCKPKLPSQGNRCLQEFSLWSPSRLFNASQLTTPWMPNNGPPSIGRPGLLVIIETPSVSELDSAIFSAKS